MKKGKTYIYFRVHTYQQMNSSKAKIRRKIISYCTDLEGDLSFFQSFLQSSKIVTARNIQTSTWHPKEWLSFDIDFQSSSDQNQFVFGGDLFDHGPGDLRLATALLQFKNTYPNQVTLLLGNRDLNKLRLLNELKEKYLTLPPDDTNIFVPYWRPQKYVTTLPQHLNQLYKIQNNNKKKNGQTKKQQKFGVLDFVPKSWRNTNKEDKEDQDKNQEGNSIDDVDTPVERLKWMLKHTMGSQSAFENRKHELNILSEKSNTTSIKDHDVLNSFRNSVLPKGVLREYLNATEIMKVHNDTLFVHGAITSKNVGRLPTVQNDKDTCDNVNEWCHQLNSWKDTEMNKWWNINDDAAKKDDFVDSTKCSLIDYGVYGGSQFQSVIYNSWLNAEHCPTENESPTVDAFLKKSNISRVVVGHQPHGDCPTVLNGDNYQVLMCDTTYCDGKPGDRHSRGDTCIEVLITQEEDMQSNVTSVCNLHGKFIDGSSFDFNVEDFNELGTKLKDGSGRYVGHPLVNENKYVLWKPGKPFPSDLEYTKMEMEQVRMYI